MTNILQEKPLTHKWGVQSVMNKKYALRDEPGKTIFVFEKNGKCYGHIVKDRLEKLPAKILFKTPKFDSIEQLKAEYPPVD